MRSNICTECGTHLSEGKSCREYFNQMLEWDFSDFTGVGKVHHLTVLCYYVQHPSRYSKEGLKRAINILQNVIENNLSDKDLYQLESETFSSANRTWTVNGTPESHGSYQPEVQWTMTVADVVKDGIQQYPDQVKKWAEALYGDLKTAGYFR